MKRSVLVGVVAVALAACSSSHQATAASRTTVTYPAHSPLAPTQAAALCRGTFGRRVTSSTPTQVQSVRHSGIGVVLSTHLTAFRGLPGADSAAWCMTRTSRAHCYDEWAIAWNRAREHVVFSCDPTLREAPRAGPPYWTY